MNDQITLDGLYAAIVEYINNAEGRFKETPYHLIQEVCQEKYGIDFNSTGLDEFELYNLIRSRAKENGYAVRTVPSKEMQWGLPYNFECFFYPNKWKNEKDDKRLSDKWLETTREDFIDQVATKCISKMSEKDKQTLLAHPDPSEHHFGYGLYIRNKYIHGKQLPFWEPFADNLSSDIIERIIVLLGGTVKEENYEEKEEE